MNYAKIQRQQVSVKPLMLTLRCFQVSVISLSSERPGDETAELL